MPQSIYIFLLACVVVELTPGPNMTYVAALSSVHGRKAGLSLVAGITAGLMVIGFVAASGAAIFIAESPVLYHALRWLGTLYMVWLAWDNWREAEGTLEISEGFDIRYFRRGFITNVLNPKAALFYITVFPSFIYAERAALPQWIWLVFCICASPLPRIRRSSCWERRRVPCWRMRARPEASAAFSRSFCWALPSGSRGQRTPGRNRANYSKVNDVSSAMLRFMSVSGSKGFVM